MRLFWKTFPFAFGFAVCFSLFALVCVPLRTLLLHFFLLCFTSLDERVHSLVLRHFLHFLLWQMGPEALSCGFLLVVCEKTI